MNRETFEKLVQAGIDLIPKEFLAKLQNVAIVVEDEPNDEQIQKLKLRKNFSLFGLYEGVPQTKRGPHYGMTLPDKITIFQKPIEQYAQTEEQISQIVRDTVWHEIAHHFGSDEMRVREAEKRKKSAGSEELRQKKS
jgi:predicted Zn-dependent protease with MMP-like domain